MKKILKIALSIAIIFILLIAGGIFFITRGLGDESKLTINDVNIAALSDGEYTGKYNSGRWTNELLVTVRGSKITDIQVIKDVLIPDPKVTDKLFKKVIEAQSLDVDAASGATVTSKAYLKAIESALKK